MPRIYSTEPKPLSPRELQALKLTAEGHSLKAVAWHMGVSVFTAHQYRKHVQAKLEVANTMQCVLKAERMGLLADVLPGLAGVTRL